MTTTEHTTSERAGYQAGIEIGTPHAADLQCHYMSCRYAAAQATCLFLGGIACGADDNRTQFFEGFLRGLNVVEDATDVQ